MAPAKVFKLLLVCSAACEWCLASAASEDVISPEVLPEDDECAAGEECALNALQLRGQGLAAPEVSTGEDEGGDEGKDSSEDGGENLMQTGEQLTPDDIPDMEDAPMQAQAQSGYLRPFYQAGGQKIWGSGKGVESINSGNVRYYDRGMGAAHARCMDSRCALIINPPGHRTMEQFHIHFMHYSAYGSTLKSNLEAKVCGKSGWHGGGLPCGGKAAFFRGFPGVFSKAMTGGSIHHASVIAWPSSCAGSGTIIQLAYGCSIEHQIRGDFDPSKR